MDDYGWREFRFGLTLAGGSLIAVPVLIVAALCVLEWSDTIMPWTLP